jgi:hypothetical protein
MKDFSGDALGNYELQILISKITHAIEAEMLRGRTTTIIVRFY